MDHPSRRSADSRRRLWCPQRDPRSLAAAWGLIAAICAQPSILDARPRVAVIGEATGRIAYVDNPFFDPRDPATLQSDISSQGDSVETTVDGDVVTRWWPSADGRLDGRVSGGATVWRGDASTWSWRVDAGAEYRHRLGSHFDVALGARGAAAAVDAFPEDRLWWGEVGPAIGVSIDDHRLELRVGLGHRRLPERVVLADDGVEMTGQQDDVYRGSLGGWTTLGDVSVDAGYALDAVRPSAGAIGHDTHTGSVGLGTPIGAFDGRLEGAIWRRSFDMAPADADSRIDTGVLVGVRLAHTVTDELEVAARYRFVYSTSNEAFGAYAQHLAGIEFSIRAPILATPTTAPARPVERSGQWTFRHRAPGAGAVAIVGDFNGWIAEPLAGPEPGGWWTATRPLDAGRYGYMFVVDGAFVRPEGAPSYADDGFGGQVGVIYVVDPPTIDRRPDPE